MHRAQSGTDPCNSLNRYRNIVRTRSTTQSTVYQESEDDEEEEVEDENSGETAEEDSEDEEEEIVEDKEPVQKQKKYSSIIRDNKRIVSEVEESKVSGAGGIQNESTPEKYASFEENTTVNSVNKVATPKYVEIRRGQSTGRVVEGLTNDVNNVHSSFDSGNLKENEIDAQRFRPSSGGESARFRFGPRQRPAILAQTVDTSQEDASEVFTIVVPDPTAPTVAENELSEEKFIVTVTPSARVVTERNVQNATEAVSTTLGTKPTEISSEPNETTTVGTTPTSTETTVVTSITESVFTERRKIAKRKKPRPLLKTSTTTERPTETTREFQSTSRRYRTTERPSTTTPTPATTGQVRGFRFRVRPTSLTPVETTSERRFIPTRARNFKPFTSTQRTSTKEPEEEERPRFQPRRPRPPVQQDIIEQDREVQRPAARRPLFPTRRTKGDLETQQSGSFFKDDSENSFVKPTRGRFVPLYLQKGAVPEDERVEEEEDNEDSEEGYESREEEEGDENDFSESDSNSLTPEDVDGDDDNEEGEEEEEELRAPVQSISDRFFKGRTRPAFEINDNLRSRNQITSPDEADEKKSRVGRPRNSLQLPGQANDNEFEQEDDEGGERPSDEPERVSLGVGLRRRPNFRNQTRVAPSGRVNSTTPVRQRRPFVRPDQSINTSVTPDATPTTQAPGGRFRNPGFNRATTQINNGTEPTGATPTGSTQTNKFTINRSRNFNRLSTQASSSSIPPTVERATERTINTTTRLRNQLFSRVTPQTGSSIFQTQTETYTAGPNNTTPRDRNHLLNRVTPPVLNSSSVSRNDTTIGINDSSGGTTPGTVVEGDENESAKRRSQEDGVTLQTTDGSVAPTVVSLSEGAEGNKTGRSRYPSLGRTTAQSKSDASIEPTSQTLEGKVVRVLGKRIKGQPLNRVTSKPTNESVTEGSQSAKTALRNRTQVFGRVTPQSVNGADAGETTQTTLFEDRIKLLSNTTNSLVNSSPTADEAAPSQSSSPPPSVDSSTPSAESKDDAEEVTTSEERKRVLQRRPVVRKRLKVDAKQDEVTESTDEKELLNEIVDNNAKSRARVFRKRINRINATEATENGNRSAYGDGAKTVRKKIVKQKADENAEESAAGGNGNGEIFRNRNQESNLHAGNRTRVLFRKRLRARVNVTEATEEGVPSANEIEESDGANQRRVLLRNPARRPEEKVPEEGEQQSNRTRVLLRKRVKSGGGLRANEVDADDQLEAEAGRVIPSPFNAIFGGGKGSADNSSTANSITVEEERVDEAKQKAEGQEREEEEENINGNKLASEIAFRNRATPPPEQDREGSEVGRNFSNWATNTFHPLKKKNGRPRMN